MKRDNLDLSEILVFGPAVLAADNTPAALDISDCGSVDILIEAGIGGITFDATNKVEFKITHSDDDSTYTAVAANDVVLGTNCDAAVGTGGIVRSLIAAHAAATLAKLAYIGGKKFLKILADFSGTHGTGTPIAVTLVKSRLAFAGQT